MEFPHPFFTPYAVVSTMQQLFYQSCVTGDTETVRQLLTPPVMYALEPPQYNPNLSYSVLLYNYGIQIACKNRNTDVIKLLFAYEPMKPYIDMEMSNSFALRTVCRLGFADIVRLILHHYPVARPRPFVELARANDHAEVVRILETPALFRIFIEDLHIDTQISTGIQLLSYQDILSARQQKYVVQFMTDVLIKILPLPRDLVTYVCAF